MQWINATEPIYKIIAPRKKNYKTKNHFYSLESKKVSAWLLLRTDLPMETGWREQCLCFPWDTSHAGDGGCILSPPLSQALDSQPGFPTDSLETPGSWGDGWKRWIQINKKYWILLQHPIKKVGKTKAKFSETRLHPSPPHIFHQCYFWVSGGREGGGRTWSPATAAFPSHKTDV